MSEATLIIMWRCSLIALATAALACAGAAREPVATPSPFEEDDPRARAEAANEPEVAPVAAPAPAPAPVLPVIPSAIAGEIPRPGLIEVLDAGFGRFLAGIELEPVFREQRFAGWQIVRFEPLDLRIARAPLAPGDIIHAVNAHPIAKPQQVQRVWDQLRTATELVIAGERSGRLFQLRYAIRAPQP